MSTNDSGTGRRASADTAATIVDSTSTNYVAGAQLNARYRVTRTIGRRGVLDLLEVVDSVRRDRRYARVLPAELVADATTVARIRREAEAGATVAHPGVLRVESIEQANDGSIFLVTEVFEGTSLADRLAQGPMPVATATEIAQKIAGALAAVHRSQLVHRDLKPAGIMLAGEDGSLEVKLTDFGLVKATGDWDATRLTQTVGLLGSPQYMSPEHIQRPHELDARADIYALGVVLFEMLVGAPPFDAPAFGSVLQMHLKQAPPDPRTRRGDIPAHVAEAVLRALAKSPDQRFATARQFAAALGTASASRTPSIAATPTSPGSTSQPNQGRSDWSFERKAAIVLAPLGLASVALIVGVTTWRTAPTSPPTSAVVDTVVAQDTSTATVGGRVGRLEAPPEALFGGRPISWWTSELSSAHRESAERTAQLTARAHALGLQIQADGGEVRAIVPPALAAATRRYWKTATSTGGATSVSDTARDELRRRAAELVATVPDIESERPSPRHAQLLLAPRPGPTAALRIGFDVGTYHDGGHAGLTRLSLHAMLAASAHGELRELAQDIDRAGGRLQIEVGLTDSAIVLTAAAPEFDALALRLLARCLAPELATARLERARARALATSDEQDVDGVSTLLAQSIFDGPGFDGTTAGERESLRTLTPADVRSHFARLLKPINASVIAAGQFDPARLREAVRRYSGGVPSTFEMPSRVPSGTYRADAYTNIRIVAYPYPRSTPTDAAAALVIADLIGERLFERFRAEGVSYGVSAAPRHEAWLDFVLVIAPFAEHASHRVGDAITEEVSELARSGLGDGDVLRAQRAVVERLAHDAQEPEQWVAEMSVHADLPGGTRAIVQALAALTPEQLAAIARPWLEATRAVQLEFSPTAVRDRNTP